MLIGLMSAYEGISLPRTDSNGVQRFTWNISFIMHLFLFNILDLFERQTFTYLVGDSHSDLHSHPRYLHLTIHPPDSPSNHQNNHASKSLQPPSSLQRILTRLSKPPRALQPHTRPTNPRTLLKRRRPTRPSRQIPP